MRLSRIYNIRLKFSKIEYYNSKHEILQAKLINRLRTFREKDATILLAPYNPEIYRQKKQHKYGMIY